MNISLTLELEQMVQRKVQSGRYVSASEVVREALRLMEARDDLQAFNRNDVKQKIAVGMASLRAGQGSDGEAVLAAMDAGLEQLAGRAPSDALPRLS